MEEAQRSYILTQVIVCLNYLRAVVFISDKIIMSLRSSGFSSMKTAAREETPYSEHSTVRRHTELPVVF